LIRNIRYFVLSLPSHFLTPSYIIDDYLRERKIEDIYYKTCMVKKAID